AAVLILAGRWWWEAQHRPEFSVPVTQGGVTLERLTLDRLPAGDRGRAPRLGGSVGDWLLSTSQISVTVGAGGPSVERTMQFGGVLDASARKLGADRLEDLRSTLYVDGRRVELETRAVEPDVSGP